MTYGLSCYDHDEPRWWLPTGLTVKSTVMLWQVVEWRQVVATARRLGLVVSAPGAGDEIPIGEWIHEHQICQRLAVVDEHGLVQCKHAHPRVVAEFLGPVVDEHELVVPHPPDTCPDALWAAGLS